MSTPPHVDTVGRRPKQWLLAALCVLTVFGTACDTGGGGGGGGGGGVGDAGSGDPADIGAASGATALVGGVRVTTSDNVTSVLVYAPPSTGFIFTSSDDNDDGTDVTDVWQVLGELVDGPQPCSDDLMISLARQSMGVYYIATSCTVELDSFTSMTMTEGPILGRFAGTLYDPIADVSVTMVDGVFQYTAP